MQSLGWTTCRWIDSSDRGVKCHTDRRSERLLLGAAEGWIKGNPLSSSSTNWCCGISPQGQELGHVEAAYAPVKGVQKKCSEKWENWENVRHTHTTKLTEGVQPCDVGLLWFRLRSCPLVSCALNLYFGSPFFVFFLSFCLFLSSCISIHQTLMSVALWPSPVAQHLTASTQWDPTRARGRWFAAVAIMPAPMDPDVLVWFVIVMLNKMCNVMIWHTDLRDVVGQRCDACLMKKD